MDKELEKLFDAYDGNLLNYFCGLSPEESKKFNELKNSKEENSWLKKQNHQQIKFLSNI